jgi:hypothetical protein
MRMKPIFLAIAIASAALVTTGAAYAGVSIHLGPGGIYVDPHLYDYDNHHYNNDWGISSDDAVRIAKRHGVRHVDDVTRHRSSYEVSGTDRHDDDITVTVDRRDGRVLDISHD